MLSLRQSKARVQSSKAPTVWDKVANHRYVRVQRWTVLSDDNAHLLKQLTENSAAPLKESALAEKDKSLVLSHPPTFSASQQYARHISDHDYMTHLKKKRG